MTRFRHDSFAKQFLSELLEPLGRVDSNYPVKDEQRFADVYFRPAPESDPYPLGVLGRMVAQSCLLEPFRNPANPAEINACLQKLFAVHGELYREAKRKKEP